MHNIKKVITVSFLPEQMLGLVEDIPSYPRFLPWCSSTKILKAPGPDQPTTEAQIVVGYRGMDLSFSTRNQRFSENQQTGLTMQLINGPFKTLNGEWRFTPNTGGCRVEFSLSYSFSSFVLAAMLGPLFGKITETMVDSFHKRAQEVYGPTNRSQP